MGYAEELAARVQARQGASTGRAQPNLARRTQPTSLPGVDDQEITPTPKAVPERKNRFSNQDCVARTVEIDDSDDDCIVASSSVTKVANHAKCKTERVASNLDTSVKDEEVLDLVDEPLTERPISKKRRKRRRNANGEDQEALGGEAPVDVLDSAATPSPKKRRKSKKSDDIAEKRGARYRPIPSKDVLQRLERAFTHRLYLVDRLPQKEDSLEREYAVMGSGGNVYKVVIGKDPRCECADYGKRGGNPCKHIFFILHRVLKVSRENPSLWQKRLITKEVESVFGNAPSVNMDGTILADSAVTEKYAQIRQSQEEENAEEGRRPLTDACAICMEDFNAQSTEATVWCKNCKNNLHRDCMSKWLSARTGGNATCPFCRGPWDEGGRTADEEGKYTNLANLSTKHREPFTLEERYPDSYMFLNGSGRRNVPFYRRRR